MNAFTESTVESAALAWLEGIGGSARHGGKIAPGELRAQAAEEFAEEFC